MFKNNPQLSQAMLDAFKAEIDGGFIHIFTGPEPTGANDPLDMDNVHTRLCMLSLDGDGVTGLELAEASGAAISKPPGVTWSGLVSFDGYEEGATSLEPTFFRFCQEGDDGTGAGATPRLQGSAGGPDSAADMKLASAMLTDDSVSTAAVAIFNYRIGSMG